jgi:multicomponent Na+:H+ antiporter subunit D
VRWRLSHGLAQVSWFSTFSNPVSGSAEWTTAGVVSGVIATVLAISVACAGLYGRAPSWLRRPARPALHGLHLRHSGHIGDYAAWLVFGSAALAGLLII